VDPLSEGPAIEPYGVQRQPWSPAAEVGHATRRGVGGDDQRHQLVTLELTLDGLAPADDAARARSRGERALEAGDGRGVDGVVELVDDHGTTERAGQGRGPLQQRLYAVPVGMQPRPPPCAAGARVRPDHTPSICDEAQELCGRSLAAAGDAATGWRHG